MKTLLSMLLLSLTLSYTAFAQVKTEEKKTSVNKATGDTLMTESVIISQSEDITPRDHMLVINPLKFLLFYNLSYFHNVSNNIVVGGGFQIPTFGGVHGFGVNAEMRFYPSGKNLRGFYIAPNVSYNHIKSGNVSTSPFSMGVMVGWQWFPGDEFAIGLGIGVDYYTGSVSDTNNDIDNYSGSVPALRFDIGYAW